jgi:hypothetical protein
MAHSQIVSDNFNDGDLSINPTWTGDNILFTTNANSQLQLNDAVAGQAYLSTSFVEESLDNKEWQFWIKQSFAPSDNNQSRFYLMSNGTGLSYPGNGSSGNQGYFIRFGEGGSDDALRLFRDDASGTPVELLSGVAAFIGASFEVRVKVTRDATGLWSLYADGAGGTNFQLQGTTLDNTYQTSSSLGWVCTYTATNADNFYLDDLYFGDIIIDTTAPQLISATAITATTLDVLFDEAVEQTSAETILNYTLEGSINPVLAERDAVNFALVHLTFGNDFAPNQDLNLSVTDVADGSGNEMSTSETTFSWFVPSTAQFRDVVINEVLADPTPVVGLADAEFIELFNAGEDAFDLAEWTLVNSSTVQIIPSHILAPGEYVVLCSEANAGFFEEALGLSAFSALTNDGDSLTLLNNTGDVLDILVYSIDWYESPEKEDK